MKMIKMGKIKMSILAIAAILILSMGGTFAYVEFSTGSIINLFNHGVVNITTDEEFDEEDISMIPVAKKVRIKNDSLENTLNVVPIYIRVSLVNSWVEDDGSVAAVDVDKLIDYKLNLYSTSKTEFVVASNVDGDWVKGKDGFYYFTGVVNPDEYTDYLLEHVSLKTGVDCPKTGHLEVNVLADAVQANLEKVNQAWNNPKDENGNLIYTK